MPRQKAQAVHTIVLVVMIGMFLFFGLFLLSGIFPEIKDTISRASCSSKQVSYCTERIVEKKNVVWQQTEGCADPTPKCEEILKQK